MDLGLKQEKDLKELFEVENGAFASGLFASVKRARSRRTGQLYAAKHSPKRKENYNEVRLLSKLSSPYIITFKDAFETNTHVVLIMEFAPGGDLQSLIDADVVLHETHASKYIHQLLQGLGYMHSKSIAHLDIKPQNLLLMGNFPQRDSIIKICDFELSRVIHPHREEREIVGTPDYVAPEILQYDPLSLKADIWSTGIVVYVLLTGFSPFGGETDTETFNNIIHNEIDFPGEIFDDVVSRAGIEFITWLCHKDPSQRPSAPHALQHVWLKSSRLSARKKGMSKSTFDLSKEREKVTQKTRLRKSKSREQLWRSKIHLSLSSEKIERWASVASFPQTTNPTSGLGQKLTLSGDELDDEAINNINGNSANNVRVQSEESLMTIILPPSADVKDSNLISSSSTHSLLGSSSSINNGTGNSNNGFNNLNRQDSFPSNKLREGLKTSSSPRILVEDEFTHGGKIIETVGDDEVQKSVAELISKFGGSVAAIKKSSMSGNVPGAINLDPIEEDDDLHDEETEATTNSATPSIDNNLGNVVVEVNHQGLRKSIASSSTGSSTGGTSNSRSSSTTTINEIKATLAQLQPLAMSIKSTNTIPALPKQVINETETTTKPNVDISNSAEPDFIVAKNNSVKDVSICSKSNNTATDTKSQHNYNSSNSTNNTRSNSDGIFSALKNLNFPSHNNNGGNNGNNLTDRRHSDILPNNHHHNNGNKNSTTTIATFPINSSPSVVSSSSSNPTISTSMIIKESIARLSAPKYQNKFTSRYEMRIGGGGGDKSSSNSTNHSTNKSSRTTNSNVNVSKPTTASLGRAARNKHHHQTQK